MNKQIVTKLLSQTTSNQMVTTHEVDLEKFAELLIKECVKLLDARDPDFNNYSRKVVADHFGIRL